MVDNRNYAALDWVIDEINETLKEARQSLEAYVEDPQDTSRLGFCTTYIHQVKGSLSMIEYAGASTLAGEMETLAVALQGDEVSFLVDAQEALMRAILQLPLYLQHCQNHRKDDLSVVLPLLNDLRASKGEPLYSEGSLFSIDLNSNARFGSKKHPLINDKQQLQVVAEKLRKMFKFAAAGVMRGVDFDNNAVYMQKATAKMEQLASGHPRFLMWRAAAALADAIADGSVEISVSVKTLLRKIDREFRLVVVHGARAIAANYDEGLIKNILYYLGRSESSAERAIKLREQFALDHPSSDAGSVIQQELTATPDFETIRTIAEALEGEFDQVKNILDEAINGGNPGDISESLGILQRVADTCAVLEVDSLRKQVIKQRDTLEALIETGVTREGLLEIADDLILIEQLLGSMASAPTKESLQSILETSGDRLQVSRAQESVMREARNGLEQTKDSIIEYIASQWNVEHLEAVPSILDAVKGALNIVPLPEVAAVLAGCRNYIAEKLIPAQNPASWQDLDTLADAIAGVEYYLERLDKDSAEDTQAILAVAEESVKKLGYTPTLTASELLDSYGESDTDDVDPVQPEEPIDSGSEEPPVSFDTDWGGAEALTPDADPFDTESFDIEPLNATSLNELDGEQSEIEPEVTVDNDELRVVSETEQLDNSAESVDTSDEITLEQQQDSEQGAEEPISLEVASEALKSDVSEERDVDDEIIEIFIEEAGEVLETIDEFYPTWAADFGDQESLTEFRRAFHTLKGSGRMVGAVEIGELAWSIENMLNRIIDGGVSTVDQHSQIVAKVRSLLPAMIQAFETQQVNPVAEQAALYQSWAEQLATGQIPEDLGQEADDLVAVDSEIVVEDSEADHKVDSENIDVFVEPSDAAVDESESVVSQVTDEDLSSANNVSDESLATAQEADDTTAEDEQDRLVMSEIFVSEAETHLSTVREFIAEMEEVQPLYEPPSDAVQRALHTLKGSAHMADMTLIAQLATPLERFLKEMRSYQVKMDDDILDLLRDGADYVDTTLPSVREGALPDIPKLDNFLARVDELRERSVAPLIRQKEQEQAGSKVVDPELLAIFMAEEMKLLLDADQILDRSRQGQVDTETFTALVSELKTLANGADHANLPPMAHLSNQLAEIHTLTDGSLAGLDDEQFKALVSGHECLLDLVDCVAAGQTLPEVQPELGESVTALLDQLQDAALSKSVSSETAETSGDLEADADSILDVEVAALDRGTTEDNLTTEPLTTAPEEPEAEQLLESVSEVELAADEEGDETSITEKAAESEVAATADGIVIEADSEVDNENEDTSEFSIEGIADIDHVESDAPESLDFDSIEVAEDIELTESDSSHLELLEGENLDEDEQSPELDEVSLESSDGSLELDNIEAYVAEDVSPEDVSPEPEEHVSEDSSVEESVIVADSEEQSAAAEAEQTEGSAYDSDEVIDVEIDADEYLFESDSDDGTKAQDVVAEEESTASEEDLEDDVDPEILEIFIEEANELVEEIEASVHDWEGNWANPTPAEELKRALHTFKGGARLAGLMGLGELAHNFETFLIRETEADNVDAAFFGEVHQYQDQLLKDVDRVKASLSNEDADIADVVSADNPDVEAQLDAAALGVDRDLSEEPLDAQDSANVVPFLPKDNVPVVSGEGFSVPKPSEGQALSAGGSPLVAKRTAPQEVVKVSAELMEDLVNLAGETSISRSRMEEQVSDMGFLLDEMDSTLLRLQEQLRRLDIETEAQILFRQEQLSEMEEFDPLEMDRYSQLQQLSRSLIESASDLFDLKASLSDKARDSETLLLQQSRINTDLQEGLMRSRMVPFSRLVPRLRRIVRQAANELGKQVNFELDNVEGELDRTVLERMVAPLEHMLRNAVDHGIESPSERQAAGKPEAGRVILSVQREGADVVLRLIDDGRGINLSRVKQKAVDLGLMTEGAVLSDQDIMQFILHAGFSTADKVTQISGRGVGMDVVHSEIKQVGGAMAIDSREGEGTQFTVRLPFTVSVNRALMIRIGDDRYAIPLNTIEGIVRVSPFELEHYYQNPEAKFDYAGDSYQVRYMGALLNSDVRPKLEGQVMPLPVVLVRSASQTVAIHVDMLMGSREIVVKSLGPQFSTVLGLSGATIMGDGSVVVILDPHALIRKEAALEHLANTNIESSVPEYEETEQKTVMVVDDSVTVRKVTSRLLEREGYNVITAKDGADAIQQLQDHMPDIMLLDIEMPRMDGFEVAKNIRTSSRLKGLPIIMITSRTGSKHRDRALDLGVNRYMGKPYQEDLLLENIKNIVGG